MKYLVVDDSKLARLSLIKSLKSYINEAEIFQAENGQEAVELTVSEKPDIVFLDLTMPIMDGYEALPKMLDVDENLKVIVVSADVQKQAKDKIMNLGAKLHVQKPINLDKMKEILDSLK